RIAPVIGGTQAARDQGADDQPQRVVEIGRAGDDRGGPDDRLRTERIRLRHPLSFLRSSLSVAGFPRRHHPMPPVAMRSRSLALVGPSCRCHAGAKWLSAGMGRVRVPDAMPECRYARNSIVPVSSMPVAASLRNLAEASAPHNAQDATPTEIPSTSGLADAREP